MEKLSDFHPDEGSRIFDRHGVEIGLLYRTNRRLIALPEIPDRLRRAFIDTEDRRFYDHGGVDLPRIAGALIKNVLEGHIAQGFSTITMQLARNIYPEVLPYTQKTLRRKLMEVKVARQIEETFTKDEILERYLNTIYLGAGAYGVEAAAQAYFGKSVKDLTLAESALLAGLPKAPTSYSPYHDPARAIERRNTVLALMREHGSISRQEYEFAKAEKLVLAHKTASEAHEANRLSAPYFIEEVRKELQKVLGSELYRGGYRIYTTLDAVMQDTAESVLEAQMQKIESGAFGKLPDKDRKPQETPDWPAEGLTVTPYIQGAMLVVDPDSGDVLAMIGGRDFLHSRFNRTTQAKRQAGSAFKPIVYAAAVGSGCAPQDSVRDTPIEVVLPTGERWAPKNFSHENKDPDVITLQRALSLSRNRATVWLSQRVGLDSVLHYASEMGIPGKLPRYPSIVLGSLDLTMKDMVSAYIPIAREDGGQVAPRMIVRVVAPDGKTVYERGASVRPAIDPRVGYVVREMMKGVIDHGTGAAVREAGYTGEAAGKTGTTNNSSDVWFIGMTPRAVTAVWIGYDQPKPVIGGRQGTGGRLAAPVFGEFMKRVDAIEAARADTVPGAKPDSVTKAPVAKDSASPSKAKETAAASDSVATSDSTANAGMEKKRWRMPDGIQEGSLRLYEVAPEGTARPQGSAADSTPERKAPPNSEGVAQAKREKSAAQTGPAQDSSRTGAEHAPRTLRKSVCITGGNGPAPAVVKANEATRELIEMLTDSLNHPVSGRLVPGKTVEPSGKMPAKAVTTLPPAAKPKRPDQGNAPLRSTTTRESTRKP